MFTKSTAIFALFSLAAQVAVATPPACMIAAVNTQSDPSDFKSVCGSSDVMKYLDTKCGDNADTAKSAFADVCKNAGVTVSTSSSSSSSQTSSGGSSHHSGSATSSGSDSSSTSGSDASATSSGSMTSSTDGSSSSGSESGSMSGTGSHSGSASKTSGSGSSPSSSGNAAPRLGLDIFGLVAIGAAGAAFAL